MTRERGVDMISNLLTRCMKSSSRSSSVAAFLPSHLPCTCGRPRTPRDHLLVFCLEEEGNKGWICQSLKSGKECGGMGERAAINAPWTHIPCSFLIPVTELTQARSSTTFASPRPILSEARQQPLPPPSSSSRAMHGFDTDTRSQRQLS